MRVYIDGCSMTYGQGLPRANSIGSLFKTVGLHETVLDMSRPGKSNQAIVSDTWNHRNDYDVYILGFTYSNRFYIKFRDQDLDFHSLSSFSISYQGYYDNNIEHVCETLHKNLYSIYDSEFYSNQSDIIVESTISKLLSLKKIVIPFSWEKRKVDHDILYPVYNQKFRLSKLDSHLNKEGTKHLFDSLQLELLKKIND